MRDRLVFSYAAPLHYGQLSEEDKKNTAKLGPDLCTIGHSEGLDHFARGVLEVPIGGVAEPLAGASGYR